MARINLLGEVRDNSALYLVQLLIGGGSLAVMIFALGAFHLSESSKLADLEDRKMALESQLASLRERTKKVDELEKKRRLLGEKLTTIATLKARKQGPVRVLDNLTVAIPPRAWLQGVTQKGEAIEFTGIALDNQTVSEFMGGLRESPYFQEVDLSFSREHTHEGVKLQQFSLTGKLSDPLMRARLQEQEAQNQPQDAVAKDEAEQSSKLAQRSAN